MDLTAFFTENGNMAFGELNDPETLMLCTQSLENIGNYYTLHEAVMEGGLLCPILFQSYGVFATRGKASFLTPARDNIFYSSTGRTMEQALFEQQPAADQPQAS